MNQTNLIGRMTQDPEMKYTASGVAVARFTLAVERPFKDKTTGKREADFIPCLVWRKQAEHVANYCRKGSQVGVTGRIQTGSFEGKDGSRVYMTEVVCENVKFLDSPKNTDSRAGGSLPNPFSDPPVDIRAEDLPF